MNHLLRGHAPISDAGWKLLDEEARERLTPALAARKLVDFSGPHGWEHSATNLGRTSRSPRRRARASAASSARCCRWSSCARTSRSPRAELRDADAAPRTPTWTRSTGPRTSIAVAENVAVFHGWARGRLSGIAEASPHDGSSSARRPTSTPARWPPRSSACCATGSPGPTGSRSGREELHSAVAETAEHGGYPLFDHLARILWRPDRVGAGRRGRGRGQPPRRRLPVRVRPGSVDRLRLATTPTWSGCTSRRASRSTWPRPRPRSSSRASRAWPPEHRKPGGGR